jgi:formylmethanofuran dehydrogenase subunit E
MKWQKIPVHDIGVVYNRAVQFHGHSGPYLALGVAIGLAGLRRLGSTGYSGIEVICYCGSEPPVSCFLDGVQVATGCTLGKGNLTVKDGRKLEAVFKTDESEIRLRVNERYETLARNCDDFEMGVKLADEILKAPIDEVIDKL